MKDSIKYCHLSVDDVGESLRRLASATNATNGLFDIAFFNTIKKWHERFGIKITLYCYALANDFIISEIPSCYRRDFVQNASWLKFGYHAKCAKPFIEETGYKAGFNLFNDTIKRLGAGKTNTLRLHYWQANPEQKKFLRSKGVRTLLTKDDDSLPYNENDIFQSEGLMHRRTRIRFENIDTVITPEVLQIGNKYIVAFTHEWCFDKEAEKIERALQLYSEHGYKFIA
ncbi:MAG: hypothetical protein LBT01_04565 [Spirochaetaceae bacterium]|nr:hypothetical protein [Spirochaetaceae bacterium]